ncbi:Nn.00g072070.m01.CDS01 [Neocucurbitaria sp. VM-36]
MSTADLFRVDGLVAVVTGGGTGIGLMIAKALSDGGASKVYILGRRKEKLDSVTAEHKGLIPIQCDITSKSSLQSAVDYITRDSGHINLLVANSGIAGPSATILPNQTAAEVRKNMFEDASMEDFTNTLNVNVTANYFSIMAFIELLDAGNKVALKGGYGKPLKEGSDVPSIQSQVVVTSSVGAFLRDCLVAPAYAASKAAVVHLVKQCSTVLAALGIRANALAPGFFPSEMADVMIKGRDPGTESINNKLFIPARRFGGQEEMGGTVLYLASRAGSFNNGLILVNDGGRLAVTMSTY